MISKILFIACLTFCLLLTYRPVPALLEYKLRVVNSCEMHWTGVIKVLVLCSFWAISEICRNSEKKWWKTAITFLLGNIVTSETQVRCKVRKTTLLYQNFVCYWQFTIIFGHKMGPNPHHFIVLAKNWRRQCDVVFDCIVMICFCILILSYPTPNYVKIECLLRD